MTTRTVRSATLLVVSICGLALTCEQQTFANTRYAVVPITDGSIGIGYWIVGTDLNKDGLVCGMASTAETNFWASKPWVADGHTGHATEIAPVANAQDYLYAGPLSDTGAVYGWYMTLPSAQDATPAVFPQQFGVPVPFGGQSHAVRWETDGSGDFDPVPGLTGKIGAPHLGNLIRSVNMTGVRVGSSREESDGPHGYIDRGYLVDALGQVHDLSAIGGPGTFVSVIQDINDHGTLCGEMNFEDGSIRGFIADASGAVTIIPPVFAKGSGLETATAWKINEQGQVIGGSALYVEKDGGYALVDEASFLWHESTGIVNLGPGKFLSDINNTGHILGHVTVFTPEGPQAHAMLRSPQGTWTDLNDEVEMLQCNGRNWLSRGQAINDRGEILVIEDWCPDSVWSVWRTYVLVPRPCESDTNFDAVVNVDDLLAVINDWDGFCPAVGCIADVGPGAGDGLINVDDLLAVINNWGQCPPTN